MYLPKWSFYAVNDSHKVAAYILFSITVFCFVNRYAIKLNVFLCN